MGRVLVTGAASGIGAACVDALRAHGWDVSGADLQAGEGLQPLDVTDESAWDRLLDDVWPLDGLVLCAGIRTRSMIVDTSIDTWRRHFDVNVTGSWLGIRGFLRRHPASGSGIVTISSVNATLAVPGQAHYVASKGAIAALTRAAALEAAPAGIRVNAVAPGPIRTPMAQERLSDPAQVAWLTGRIPLGRVGEAPEVAGVVAFLLSAQASYISGETIQVDGGWAANAV